MEAYKHISNLKLNQELGWQTLQIRRSYHKLCGFHKIDTAMVTSYLTALLPPLTADIHSYHTRN